MPSHDLRLFALSLAAAGSVAAAQPGSADRSDALPPGAATRPDPVVRHAPTGAIPDDPRLAQGHYVYQRSCSACHEGGTTGAPRMTDVENWQARLSKDREVLYRNAIEGYQGESGYMPPKGGSPASWTDEQVRAAVDYMAQVVREQAGEG